jgi:hypothetical protein
MSERTIQRLTETDLWIVERVEKERNETCSLQKRETG